MSVHRFLYQACHKQPVAKAMPDLLLTAAISWGCPEEFKNRYVVAVKPQQHTYFWNLCYFYLVDNIRNNYVT
jgi:hypothetical protein